MGYFSIQLAKEFHKLGYEVYLFDLLQEKESFEKLCDFCKNGVTCAVLFNFTGLRKEDCFYPKDMMNFWDDRQIPCYNIVVDHPFYYHELIEHVPKRYYQICIDSFHETYMQRFFPKIDCIPWMPLGGTSFEVKSWEKREKITVLLKDEEKLERIAQQGNRKAMQDYTWKQRAKYLSEYIKKNFN